MRVIASLAAAAVGYGVGNLPSADLASRAAGGADLRVAGTRNPGAMNAGHVLGRKWGLAVSAADVGKGFVAGRLGARIGGPAGANIAATAAVVVGHCFPRGRRGGKGVATSVGQVVATFPAYLPVDIAVAVGTSMLPFLRQRTRTATALASATWFGCGLLAWRRGFPNPGGVEPTAALPIAALASSLVIAVRFRTEAENVAAFNQNART
ncbi:MAG: glycerol-3-phosphate acyltransferase [Acidimicrobiales bacterium]